LDQEFANNKIKLYDELDSKTTTNVHSPHIIFEALTRTQVPEL
jgi:hypothetical protein